ncbi:hypothetical protein [Sphingomonas sp. Ant20]|uniref:hypothetical protein n=1 Tax=Sphingomonas sp. Ant20 TaxID=104605 RepID=UPI000FE13DA3|nr:hypothetical protein [Sphingomonas sp. Ant20]
MAAIADNQYYAMRAQQELDMASLATDPIVKVLHLNMAAEYAALRERADAEVTDAGNGAGG